MGRIIWGPGSPSPVLELESIAQPLFSAVCLAGITMDAVRPACKQDPLFVQLSLVLSRIDSSIGRRDTGKVKRSADPQARSAQG